MEPELLPELGAIERALVQPVARPLSPRRLQLAPALAFAVAAAFGVAELASDDVSQCIAIASALGATGYARAVAPTDADANLHANPCALCGAVPVADTGAQQPKGVQQVATDPGPFQSAVADTERGPFIPSQQHAEPSADSSASYDATLRHSDIASGVFVSHEPSVR